MLKKKTKEKKNKTYEENINEDNSKYLPKKKVMKENFFEEFIKRYKRGS